MTTIAAESLISSGTGIPESMKDLTSRLSGLMKGIPRIRSMVKEEQQIPTAKMSREEARNVLTEFLAQEQPGSTINLQWLKKIVRTMLLPTLLLGLNTNDIQSPPTTNVATAIPTIQASSDPIRVRPDSWRTITTTKEFQQTTPTRKSTISPEVIAYYDLLTLIKRVTVLDPAEAGWSIVTGITRTSGSSRSNIQRAFDEGRLINPRGEIIKRPNQYWAGDQVVIAKKQSEAEVLAFRIRTKKVIIASNILMPAMAPPPVVLDQPSIREKIPSPTKTIHQTNPETSTVTKSEDTGVIPTPNRHSRRRAAKNQRQMRKQMKVSARGDLVKKELLSASQILEIIRKATPGERNKIMAKLNPTELRILGFSS